MSRSVHTQTTAGYGVIAPFSIYCNICILAHCWTGTIFIALVTSILLLNITRPKCAPPWTLGTSRGAVSAVCLSHMAS
jgi:hypothetical protein